MHAGKSTSGRTALKNTYERETILLAGNKNQYFKNNERHWIKPFGQGLDKEFLNTSAETKEAYSLYRKKRRNGVILLCAGGAVMIGSMAFAPLVPVLIIPFIAGTGSYVAGAISTNKSRKFLQKSVWLRNRDVLLKN